MMGMLTDKARGNRVRLIAKFIANHSRERLAADCLVSVGTVRAWEEGTLPSSLRLPTLARVLDCTLEEIVG